MARLRYVDPGASTAADAAYAEVGRMGRPILNLYRALANQPPALAAFLQMSRYVRSESSLEPGLRELVILATAQELKQAYELSHHVQAAQREGVSAKKIAAVAQGEPVDLLSEPEQCAVEFARQVALTRTCDDQLFGRLQSAFSDEQIVDLVVTTAWYHLCAVILGSLMIELEADDQ